MANQGSEEVRVFGADGSFVDAFGAKGHGPGEFNGLARLQLLGDSLVTHDHANDRLTVFAPDRTYARSFRLEWESGLLGPEDVVPGVGVLSARTTHMVDLRFAGLNVDTAQLSLHDLEGRLVRPLLRVPHNTRFVRRRGNMQTTLGAPLSPMASIAATDGGFCHAFGPAPEVNCYGWDGRGTTILRLAEEPRPTTSDDIAAFKERFLASRRGDRPDLRAMLEQMPYPDQLAAFDRMLRGPDGALWVRRFAPDPTKASTWIVFGPDGRARATLEASAGVEIWHVAGGRVLATVQDALGVESFAVFEIRS